MTAYTASGLSVNWNDPTAWLGDSGYPNSASDTATLGDGSYSITITSGSSFTVGNLALESLGSNYPFLYITGDGTLGSASLDIAYTGPSVNPNPTTGLTTANSGGYVELVNGGELEVDSGVGAANIEVDFDDSGATSNSLLVLNAPANQAGDPAAITNFRSVLDYFAPGDGIVLKNAVFDGNFADYKVVSKPAGYQVTSSNGSLIYAANLDLNPDTPLGGGQFYAVTDFNIGGTNYLELIVACFQAGTHLLTDRGEVAVEDLREGDMMVTFSGRGETLKPVTWIGQRRIDLVSHDNPEIARPVRIRAGAFGEAIPHRDLLVSPDHAVYVDGLLIPAKHLINGTTITQDASIEEAHYFHVEVDEHDVLLAEGLTVESYLDTGNRDVFAAVAPQHASAYGDDARI